MAREDQRQVSEHPLLGEFLPVAHVTGGKWLTEGRGKSPVPVIFSWLLINCNGPAT